MESATSNFQNKELYKLRLVFEQTPGAIFILDREFRFEYVNPGYEKLSGFSKAELIGKSVAEIFSQTEYTEPREEILKSMIAGEKWEGEMRTYKKDGSTYWATTVSSPFSDDNGNLEGYIIIQQDVSDLKNIENALRESETKYKTLVENSHDGIMIIRDNRILYANDTICDMMGYCLSGKSVDIIHPDDRAKMRAIVERRRNGDTSTIHESLRMIAKNGETRECETTSTMIQFEGEWAEFYTVHNITERNRFEQELKKSEQKYREMTEMMPIGVYELDLEGRIKYINLTGRKLFNFDSGLVSTPSAMSLFTNDDSEFMRMNLKNEIERLKSLNFYAEQEEVAIPVEFMAKRADGTEFPVLVYVNYILEDKKVTGFRGIIIDISERKAMENAMRESEEKYKTLIENSQDGIFAIVDNQILFANKTLCKMLGYSAQELYSKTAVSLLHQNDQERGLAISVRRSKGDHSTVNDVFRFVAKDGSIKEGDVFSSVLELNGQTVSYITVHDLTEIRRIQNEVAKSERKYRELAEVLPQTVYELDLNANLRYLNKAGRDKFGTAYENSDISVFSIVVPDQLERMKQNFTNVSFKNIPSKGNFYKLRQVNGQVFEAMISATPMIVDGKTVGQRGVVIDISDHVTMQKALSESEEKYRNLIENATDGIVIVQKGLLKFANQYMCDIMNYSMEELLDKPFLNYIDNTEHESLSRFHNRRMEGEQFSNILRSQFIRKDGKMITVELNARTSNYNGSPAGFIVIRDISERIKIEEELQIAKTELEKLNSQLEKRVKESSKRLTEARTQLINLQKENLQSQYDVLKQQVNPHFLFNSLNVLTSLIKLEPDLAEKFSEQLSKVYRYVLENKDNELVDLNTELNFLDAYIFLLNIRFVGKLVVNLNIPDENRNDQIIPLAMQLLIENAIKHNVMSKTNPLIIDIYVDADSNLNVINNLQARPSQIMSTGVGLKNILNRYKLLNLIIPTFEKSESQFIAKIQLVKNTTKTPIGA